MNYIKTYESFGSDESDLQKALETLSQKVDTKKLYNILKPYKKVIKKLSQKYSKDGVVNADLIESDIKLPVTEGLSDIVNKIVKFIKLPFTAIQYLFRILSDLWGSGMGGKLYVAIAAIFIFVIGFMGYQIGEHAINGIEVGMTSNVEFIPEHYETRHHSYTSNGKTHHYTTREFVPDTWKTDVRATNGRVETWDTTNKQIGRELKEDDVIRMSDDWNWEITKEYGEEQVGKFSGGGSGDSY